MIKLYHGPRTRSIRIYWLLEELGLTYELETVEYRPPNTIFSQQTPLGKFPVLDDGEVVMFESGAILDIVRHTMLKPEPERIPAVAADGRVRALATLAVVERALDGKEYLPGPAFSGADVMFGYPLLIANLLGMLDDRLPNVRAYWNRLASRPALRKAAGLG